MSDYGIELGFYRNFNDIIEIIKTTPKTITVRPNLKRIEDWKLQEELGYLDYEYIIETNWAYEPKRYRIIAKDNTVGIKNNGNSITYFTNNYRFCYEKLDMEKVKLV
tara:strand:+ start:56 stop:376 length:321 start_codon:yes stop_codon:yes gene_type:complete